MDDQNVHQNEEKKTPKKRKYTWAVSQERREELCKERLENMRRGIDAAKARQEQLDKEHNEQA